MHQVVSFPETQPNQCKAAMADCYEVTNMESHSRGDVKGKTSLAMGALRLLEQWFTEHIATVREIATQHVWMTAQVRTHMRGKHTAASKMQTANMA